MLRRYLKEGLDIKREFKHGFDGNREVGYWCHLSPERTISVVIAQNGEFWAHADELMLDGITDSAYLADATSRFTLIERLPDGCQREEGLYAHATAHARVKRERNQLEVFAAASTLQAVKEIWQALLDGSIRPERPLFNQEQQGPSYSKLAVAVADMLPKLRQATDLLSRAEGINIHLNAVVKSCSQALQGQTETIADLQGALATAEHQRQLATQQINQLLSSLVR